MGTCGEGTGGSNREGSCTDAESAVGGFAHHSPVAALRAFPSLG